MFWFEQKIRRYEHSRWANEPSRPVMPFRWGLEHIGGRADEPDPRGWLENFATETIAHSDEWFSAPPATDYRLTGPGEVPWEAGQQGQKGARQETSVMTPPLGTLTR